MRFCKKAKNLQLLIVASFFCVLSFGQKGKIEGYVRDNVTNEGLVNALVVYGEGKSVLTNLDGFFSVEVPNGTYELKSNYVTYITDTQIVTVNNNKVSINFEMKSSEIGEVEIVVDLAKPRETPVAYSNISAQKIQEELGSKDIPMILNSTPGVYATQQGGGDGDARVSIRGFNSQNVLVLVDGVPMNDMFNGRVFWTNWFGLENMTRTIQVQRGLGASKLAIPAIGGTMNILTQGLDFEKKVMIKQEVGNDLNLRTTFTGSTGRLKGDWNIQGALSYKYNEGWVDGLRSSMFFYYFKVSKKIGKHVLSLQTFGAPQESGQKSFLYATPIETYSKDYALGLGVDTSTAFKDYGWRYYQGWNKLKRTRADEGGPNAKEEFLNTTVNQFYKPVISLKDFIAVNEKFHISLIAYASFGIGGGTQLNQPNAGIDSAGQINLQNIYNTNATGPLNSYVNSNGDTLRRSTNFIRKNHNEHSWYGFLATFDHKFPKNFSISGGLDFRYYNGRVFSTVKDLLGGDLILNSANLNEKSNSERRIGDKIQQDIERDILWGGAFALAEYTGKKISAFINVSSAINGYKQFNHFQKREVLVGDSILRVGYGDTLNYNGETYTLSSSGVRVSQSDWFARGGFTVKGGMNYNINKNHNVFFNAGYFSRAPMMTFLVRSSNEIVRDAQNERLTSVELGYTFKSKKFTGNLNMYYTLWDNKPTTVSLADLDGNTISINANNMGARHMGVEVDFAWVIIKQLTLEGMASIGDWIWNKIATAEIYDEVGNLVSQKQFDPRGVKVGDAAQHTYSVALRIAPIKNMYITPRINIFTHNYANYSPDLLAITNLQTGYGPNIGRPAWRMPDYFYLDVNVGYGFFIKKKVKMDIRGNFMNVTNNFYISDAQDSEIGAYKTFSAGAANVNVGLGFRWLGSVAVSF